MRGGCGWSTKLGLPARGPVAVRQRRQAVIALTVFCWLFFIGAIAASYVIALAHG
jgi:hypothetical protein